jgi:hypothetical protein
VRIATHSIVTRSPRVHPDATGHGRPAVPGAGSMTAAAASRLPTARSHDDATAGTGVRTPDAGGR